jgi:hypothetical protein
MALTNIQDNGSRRLTNTAAAANLGVSQDSNRLNSSGRSLPTVKSRTSLTYNNIILAGATIPIPCAGTEFYLEFSTAQLLIRPSGGVFNPFSAGLGLQLDLSNAFDLVEVQNLNAFPVVFSLFIGFDGLIDNRLFLQNNQLPQVAFPTYQTQNSATTVAINDISGAQFSDINGGKWYAISRSSLTVYNPDGSTTLLLQKAGALSNAGPAIGVVYPTTTLQLNVSGNYSLNAGGGPINAIVSEIYTSLAAS